MQESRREKKITVKFFLNEAVEPVKGEGKKQYYPLYVQVTYRRKNMQFRSKYGEYYASLDEVKPSLIRFEEKAIKSIVTYEARKEKGEYDLKGLKRKYELYSLSILEVLEQYLKPKLRLASLKTGSELAGVLNFGDPNVTVGQLYEAARLLFQGFEDTLSEKLKEELESYAVYQKMERPVLAYNFLTLIEWADGSCKQRLEETLAKAFKGNSNTVTGVKTLLDHAVKAKLKDLDT